MRKVLSAFLAITMICTAMPTVFAAGNWESGTAVAYDGSGTQVWEVTVPATMAPGGTETIVAEGTWPSNLTLVVDADDTVIIANEINQSDTMTLSVEFDGIELDGSNTAAVRTTAPISIEEITDSLFGLWTGHFSYSVKLVNANKQSIDFTYNGLDLTADEGMTWDEYIDSDYNQDGFYSAGGYVVQNGDKLNILITDEIVADKMYSPGEQIGVLCHNFIESSVETLDFMYHDQMTWREFIRSPFNTIGLYEFGGYVCHPRYSLVFQTDRDDAVTVDETVESSACYYFDDAIWDHPDDI